MAAGGQAVPSPKGRKTWGLIAYLVLHDVPSSRQRVAELLFPEASDPLGALRWALMDARRLLGEEAQVGGDPLVLTLPAGTFLDVRVLDAGRRSESSLLPTLGGDLLERFTFPSAPGFDLWLAGERRRLRAQAAAVLHETALASLARGELDEAVGAARRVVTLDALDENNHVLLVRCLAASGQDREASQAAEQATSLLRSELGVEPTSALRTAARDERHRDDAWVPTRSSVSAQMESGQAAIDAGSWERGFDLLRQAVATARRLGEPHLHARAAVALGSALVHAARGLDEEGSAALHEGGHLARRVGDRTLAAAAARELAYVEYLRARYHRALQWLETATDLCDGDARELTWIKLISGGCLTDIGHYGQARLELDEAIAIADREGLVNPGAFARSLLGRWHLLRDELPAARTQLTASIAQARAHGWASFVPWPQALLGEVELRSGDDEQAEETFEHAYSMGCELGDVCWESMALRGRGLIAARRGDVEQAVTLLERAPRRCRELPDSYLWIAAYGLESLCSLGTLHGLGTTVRWVEELERAATQTGLRELAARALLHRVGTGQRDVLSAAADAVTGIDNPALHRDLEELSG